MQPLQQPSYTCLHKVKQMLNSRVSGENMNGQIGFRISEQEKKAFIARVQKQGKKPSEVLAAFVRSYIEKPEEQAINEVEQMRARIKQHEDRIAHLESQSLGELSA
jgi:hypothetical protein